MALEAQSQELIDLRICCKGKSPNDRHQNAERYLDSLNEDILASAVEEEGEMLSLSAHSLPQSIYGYLHLRNPNIA